MNPQAKSVEFGTSDSIITHQPAGCCKSDSNANEGDGEYCNPTVPSQRSTLQILPEMENMRIISLLEFYKVAKSASRLIEQARVKFPEGRENNFEKVFLSNL